eukprot:6192113-Pleurochrysis_carterae.AAC.3
MSLPGTGLQSRAIAGGTPDDAAGSAPAADGQCEPGPPAPQRRTLPSRSSRSCIDAGTAQQRSRAPAAPRSLGLDSTLSRTP